ncbi:hypothetical protein SAMN05216198_0418 [Halopseudomonas litoralis]|uniref:Uncharacterized protein n=1 Tax=Halopseudomonas litoralis TaxID=797277 RepID=A0A1H1LXC3_9GAMM|nr:hypothetical protein [Halopseudomonas litoralis]SDR78902.1 hypothetical protein SAMN05216198_0418 [Halopseudomonas litoralis]
MSEKREVNKLPYILTALGTLFLTMGMLHFYGYLNFANEEEGLLVAEFSLVTVGSEEAGQLRSKTPNHVAECVDGVLILHNTRHNGLSGLLVDERQRVVRCNEQTVPVAQ